jgi:hypothetical protein
MIEPIGVLNDFFLRLSACQQVTSLGVNLYRAHFTQLTQSRQGKHHWKAPLNLFLGNNQLRVASCEASTQFTHDMAIRQAAGLVSGDI